MPDSPRNPYQTIPKILTGYTKHSTVFTGLSQSDHPNLRSMNNSNMSDNDNLQEHALPSDAGEAAHSGEDMDQEVTPTPIQAAEASLQGLDLGDKEKHAKELEIANRLLDQVKGFFGFDKTQTRAKASKPVTHSDLDKVLLCSSQVALKHAEACGIAAVQQVEALKAEVPAAGTIKILEDKIQSLQDKLDSVETRLKTTEDTVKEQGDDMVLVKQDIGRVKTMLQAIDDRINALDTNIQLNDEQYKRLRSEIWQSLSHKVLELAIEDHKRKLVIYGLENMGYNVQANNRQIYKKIITDANMRDQLPESCTLRVDFLGRRTSETQKAKQPAMIVTYNSEDLVYVGLKLKAALKNIECYNRVFFRKSVPPEYKDAYNRMDKTRQSFYNARDGNRKIYEARIDFISVYMCLKVKTLIHTTHTPWTIYSLWCPGYDDFKPVSKPVAQQFIMPIIVAKIIPFADNSTIARADREKVGKGYRERLDEKIKHKCVYGIWNDRGSVFTMGFKLNCKEDLETLKMMESIFKEESHIHQFIIPFETAVWNEQDIPPRTPQNNNAQASNTQATNTNSTTQQASQLALNTDQVVNQNSSSGSTPNTNNEQQHLAPLPQREDADLGRQSAN